MILGQVAQMGYKSSDEYLTNGNGVVSENEELIENFNV
jgi:hypothetical protein